MNGVNGDQRKRLLKALGILSGMLILLVGYALFVRLAGFGLPCVYNRLFGIQCAGCGLSRASAALLSLDFRGAFGYNAVWPLYVGYALWAIPGVIIPYVKEGHAITLPKPMNFFNIAFKHCACCICKRECFKVVFIYFKNIN